MSEHWEKVIEEAVRKGFVEKEKIPETVPHNYSEVFDSKRLSQTYLFNTEFGAGLMTIEFYPDYTVVWDIYGEGKGILYEVKKILSRLEEEGKLKLSKTFFYVEDPALINIYARSKMEVHSLCALMKFSD